MTQLTPYSGRPSSSFWKQAVYQNSPLDTHLYRKRFAIDKNVKIAAAGSCFAQHISRHLRQKGCNVLDVEPPPKGLSLSKAQKYGYFLYSARYGNIYTARQLFELVQEARGKIPLSDLIWERDGRYFDALRPNIEPSGLASPDEVRDHRRFHLRKVLSLIRQTDLFVFTFGLTEAWQAIQHGNRTLPSAPGVIAGMYEKDAYQFQNFNFQSIYADFRKFRRIIKRSNKDAKFLVTVSPVPLTATASGLHVLQASIYSKSILRAVCGQLYKEFDDVDYFPSYEIIGTPFVGSDFYEDNLRSVSDRGVETVMKVFFAEHRLGDAQESGTTPALATRKPRRNKRGGHPTASANNVVCEELLLEAFGSG